MLDAYGITVSQAVVKIENDYKKSSSKLEKRLKIQRNKASIPLDLNLSILKLNPKTALPLVNKEFDQASFLKDEAFEKYKKSKEAKQENNIYDIEKLANKDNKVAIIHIDGNGLGNIVKELNEKEMVEFSEKLDNATKEAYNVAKECVVKNEKDVLKIRKVILDGDDLAVICDASSALDFTIKFLEEFENKTKKIYKDYDLTACAGITFCNSKYPFHYAIKLAEDLCSYAKKDSKAVNSKLPPSSLMFHNIQSSNVDSFSKFIEDELNIGDIRMDFGAYYLQGIENKPNIKILQEIVKELKKENSPKGKLRDWLSTLSFDKKLAESELKRVVKMAEDKKWRSENLSKLYSGLSLEKLIVQKDGVDKSPIYDILQIEKILKGNKDDI
ncbi:hypothetical protein FE244_07090 [Aliarcobacter thereius]|nr:hypothetical protein FE244_07090 [Aliarcobacter thereius]